MKFRNTVFITALMCCTLSTTAAAEESDPGSGTKAKNDSIDFPDGAGKAYAGKFVKKPSADDNDYREEADPLPEMPPPWRLSPYKSRGFLAVEGLTIVPEQTARDTERKRTAL